MADCAVIGAGPMGLACARELLLRGHRVTVYEADKVIGGMSASFDFAGARVERFYHFICKTDHPYIDSLEELGIENSLRWVHTRMGYFHRGRQQDWGTPWALLRFRGIGPVTKLRYALLAAAVVRRRNWLGLDQHDAASWLRRWCGEEGWRELWEPLFRFKFHHHLENLSAAWIWARMRRTGQSRGRWLREELGYLEGGSDTWLHAMEADILARGGRILLSSPVEEVLLEGGAVRGVRCGLRSGLRSGEGVHSHDGVISTIPLPFVPAIIPGLPEASLRACREMDNLGVVCVLVRMKRPLSPYFWMNISDPGMALPGVIEYSRLNPAHGHLLYMPWYLPRDHPDYQRDDEWFTARAREYLGRLNPDFRDDDIEAIGAGRYGYAQPVCPPRFPDRLPPMDPGIRGLRMGDTSCYYPEDRSISESIRLGKALAADLDGDTGRRGTPPNESRNESRNGSRNESRDGSRR